MLFFFFNDTATTEIYTLSLHDALPIFLLDTLSRLYYNWADAAFRTAHACRSCWAFGLGVMMLVRKRSEEHTSELQSRLHLVCRLLLEKKKKKIKKTMLNIIITIRHT